MANWSESLVSLDASADWVFLEVSKLPLKTINTLGFFTGCWDFSFFSSLTIGPWSFCIQHVQDQRINAMIPHADMPAQPSHRIIHDRLAQMTPGLECVANLSAWRSNTSTSSLWYWVRIVIYVSDGHARQCGREIERRKWQMKPMCCHTLAGSFKGNRRQSKSGAQERGETPAETVSDQPYVSERV